LSAKFADSDIRFNLSHSHGLAAYAIARGREVGVDVEMVRPDFATRRIAEQFFSRTEVESLRSLPREHQTGAFFVCWTRKEAHIKALGRGLSIDLASFDVSLRPEERPALLRCVDAAHWSLEAFQPCDGYVGAIAVQGPVCLRACDGLDDRPGSLKHRPFPRARGQLSMPSGGHRRSEQASDAAVVHSAQWLLLGSRLIWRREWEANPDRLQTLGPGKRERAERGPALEGSS
jgi:phosphopantetheine--protein transferase-like protein